MPRYSRRLPLLPPPQVTNRGWVCMFAYFIQRFGWRHAWGSSVLLSTRRLATAWNVPFPVRTVAGHWLRTIFSPTLHTLVGSTDVILVHKTRSALSLCFLFVLLHVFSFLRIRTPSSLPLRRLNPARLCILPLVHDRYPTFRLAQ